MRHVNLDHRTIPDITNRKDVRGVATQVAGRELKVKL